MASSEKQIVVAFDLYGTLLSTESVAKELATHFGKEKAPGLAASWRRYQLEYTWRLNSMKQYQPFSTVTRNALRHALSESDSPLDSEAIEKLMKAYDSLSTFPDVSATLDDIAKASWLTPVVFSNGTLQMVSNSVHSSPDLSPHASAFKSMVTVESVKCFKPDPAVYYHLAEQVGKSREEMGSMWLVSGNPFDIVGARAVGMQAAWVDRKGEAWVDALVQDEGLRPTIIVRDLKEIMKALRKPT